MSKATETKNDLAWKSLFDKYNILTHIQEHGHFLISSKEINEYREARLMTKFDHKSNLPGIFRYNDLAILPSSRGTYLISDFNPYCSIIQDEKKEVKHVSFPLTLQSIDLGNIYSESLAINCAFISGMLNDFLNEDVLYPTVNGRMSSGSFDYYINRLNGDRFNFTVNNSQIEIDGGFEGIDCLALVEAKNSVSSDFIVRQLYYPFRLWQKKISKSLRPLFLTYSNGIFDLHEFKFSDMADYNSISLVKHERYTFEEAEVTVSDIQELLAAVRPIPEPEIPFPQADSFDRVINLCELLFERKNLTADEITSTYDFDRRQTDYYTNAGRYLGLIEKDRRGSVSFSLTKPGYELFGLSYRQRQLRFAQLILEHRVFGETLKLSFKKADSPTKDEIVKIMKQCELNNMRTDGLYIRRASTVAGWVNWILGLQYI